MGALYLKPLDDRMAELGCFYVRFMDDWAVLAPTRWKLRRAIRAVNVEMAALRVEQHPDKTFIGRIERGFDFLGYWFSSLGVRVATKTVERMREKVSRLYEQGATERCIEAYPLRWVRWVRSGVGAVTTALDGWVILLWLLLGYWDGALRSHYQIVRSFYQSHSLVVEPCIG